MALKIRLQRHGASHRPFYRMVVTEAAARRDGRFVELLGTYEPQAKRPEDELKLKLDRIDYWTSVGAKPSDTASSLIRKLRRGAPVTAGAAPAAPVSEPEPAPVPEAVISEPETPADPAASAEPAAPAAEEALTPESEPESKS